MDAVLRYLRPRLYPKKPSLWLGFVVLVVIWTAVVFVMWQVTGEIYGFKVPLAPPKVEPQQGAVLLGIFCAVIGWLTSSFITMRNSIKQHTINTLLNSRLSTEYMKNAREVNDRFFSSSLGLYQLTDAERLARHPDSKIAELNYFLNYLEFISAAVKSGDLDERLMRETLRGMVCNFYAVAKVLIDASRVGNPKALEHLTWLYGHWSIKSIQRKTEERNVAAAGSTLAPAGTSVPAPESPPESTRSD